MLLLLLVLLPVLQDMSGGDASTLDNLIYLCSRADRDPLLFFTGQVAQLQVRTHRTNSASHKSQQVHIATDPHCGGSLIHSVTGSACGMWHTVSVMGEGVP